MRGWMACFTTLSSLILTVLQTCKQTGFPGDPMVKNPPAMQETQEIREFDPWIEKIP